MYTEFTQRLIDVSFPPPSSAPYHCGVRVPTFPSVYQTANHDVVLPWGLRSSATTKHVYSHEVAATGNNDDISGGGVSGLSSEGSAFAAAKVVADKSLIPRTSEGEEGNASNSTALSMPPSFPIEALWYSYPGGAEKLLHDGIHPRRVGHDLLAQLVAQAIN